MQYTICEISGRQYMIKPGQMVEVDKLQPEQKTLEVDKILLIADGDKIEIGKPYLKKLLKFEIVDTIKKPKIRVSKYKPKANYRKVTGQRAQVSRIKLLVDEQEKKI